ncbi:MAG: DegT/DnrJ/EryC1/StrS aminotransferase family protein, partial [Ruthenibacterium sp.]
MEFRDLKAQYQHLKVEIDAAIQKVCANANYISGAEVKELEQSLADYVGVKHCITCANGTDALSLVLMSWNIGKGDAVLVPDFTFFASGETVAFEDATPIFVDVDRDTFNLDAVKLEEKIIEIKAKGEYNLKAVISVDLFGLPANYPQIEAVCKKYNLLLLEDGAQG